MVTNNWHMLYRGHIQYHRGSSVLFTYTFPNKLISHKISSIFLEQVHWQHSTFHPWLAMLVNKVNTKGSMLPMCWLHEHLWWGAAAVGRSRCQLCRPMDLPVPPERRATMLCLTAVLQSELTVILSKYHFAAMQAAHCQHLGSSVLRG